MTGQHIKIDNRKFDGRFNNKELRYSPGESVLVIPVRVESELHPIAVIQAINKVPHHSSMIFGRKQPRQSRILAFSETDSRMLKIFATSVSVVIRNSLLFQREDGLRRKNEAMVSILKALQQKHDVTQMLTDATVSIRDALEAERVTMWFEDGSGNLDSLDVSTEDANTYELSELFAAIARYSCEEKVLINGHSTDI